MSKADNMLAILWLLKSRHVMTAKQLAEALEIHVRTVYRCIDALCASGVPIIAETGRAGGYRIPEQLDALERHEAGLEVVHPPVNPSLRVSLQSLEHAAAERTTLSIRYQSGYEGASRCIDPYGLVHWKSKWYVVGYCNLREEYAAFVSTAFDPRLKPAPFLSGRPIFPYAGFY